MQPTVMNHPTIREILRYYETIQNKRQISANIYNESTKLTFIRQSTNSQTTCKKYEYWESRVRVQCINKYDYNVSTYTCKIKTVDLNSFTVTLQEGARLACYSN